MDAAEVRERMTRKNAVAVDMRRSDRVGGHGSPRVSAAVGDVTLWMIS